MTLSAPWDALKIMLEIAGKGKGDTMPFEIKCYCGFKTSSYSQIKDHMDKHEREAPHE